MHSADEKMYGRCMKTPEHVQPERATLSETDWEYIEQRMPQFRDAAAGALYTHENEAALYGIYVNPMQLDDGETKTVLNVYRIDKLTTQILAYYIDPATRELEVFQLRHEDFEQESGMVQLIESAQFQRIVGQSTPGRLEVAEIERLLADMREQDDLFASIVDDTGLQK